MSDEVMNKSAGAAATSLFAKVTAPGRVEAYGKKFIRYLSGGGLAAFTRTAEEEKAEAKQDRFLFVAVIAGVVWLVFWIF